MTTVSDLSASGVLELGNRRDLTATPPRESRCPPTASYSLPSHCVPDFTEFLYLDVYTSHSLQTFGASHFQEEHMHNLWSSVQLIEQVLL